MGSYVISVSAGTGCYRHIQISANATLERLHKSILEAFGFDCDEYAAYAFFMDNRLWSPYNVFFADGVDDCLRSAKKYTLKKAKLVPGSKFKYLYDFADEWPIQCKVLREVPDKTAAPKVIRSVGENPVQYADDDEEDETDDLLFRYYPEPYDREQLDLLYKDIPIPEETVELLHTYFDSAAELYGIIPLRKLLEIYNLQNPPLSEAVFLAASEVFRHEQHLYAILGKEAFYADAPASEPMDRELVAQHLYDLGIEEYHILAAKQQGTPFYIPEKEEFLLACTDRAYPETPQSKRMLSYLSLKRKALLCSPEEILLEMQDLLNMDTGMNEIAEQIAQYGFYCSSLQDAQRFFGLLADLNNHTRKLSNRGHTPMQLNDLFLRSLRPQVSPESAPDPDLLTGKHGIIPASQLTVTPKTPSNPPRNGPCPCGSGRKYKNCCGKEK